MGTGLVERRAEQDSIDDQLRQAFAVRDLRKSVEELLAAGVPAACIVDPRALTDHPQLVARHFMERIDHPVVGPQSTMGAPFRFASVDRWLRRPAPPLGQHNHEILAELGYAPGEIEQLEAEKVIGHRPEGV